MPGGNLRVRIYAIALVVAAALLAGRPTVDAVLDKLVAVAAGEGLQLYLEQEGGVLELFDGKNVIRASPTRSAKSFGSAL